MTDLPAECRKHSDELPLPYEVKVTLLDAAARIERLEAAVQWRPIEEAPKDGAAVLLYSEAWEMSWGVVTGSYENEAWETAEGTVHEDEADEFGPLGPTHWMPLPAPPAGETNEL